MLKQILSKLTPQELAWLHVNCFDAPAQGTYLLEQLQEASFAELDERDAVLADNVRELVDDAYESEDTTHLEEFLSMLASE